MSILPHTGPAIPMDDSKNIVEEKAEIMPVVETPPVEGAYDLSKASWAEIKAEAEAAEEYEHSLTLWQSIKVYKAVSTTTLTIWPGFTYS